MSAELLLQNPHLAPEGESLYNTFPTIPGGHLLFAGPLACARHGMHAVGDYQRRGKISYYYTSLAEETLGADMDGIVHAALEIHRQEGLRCLVVLVGCQSAVVGMPYPVLQKRLEAALHIPVRIMEVNRLFMYSKRKKPMMKVPQQEVIYSFLEKCPPAQGPTVNLIAHCRLPWAGNDLLSLLRERGIRVQTLGACQSYEEFQRLAQARLNICLAPNGVSACRRMEGELGIPWVPLYAGYDLQKLRQQYESVFAFFQTPMPACPLWEEAEEAFAHLGALLRGQEVAIDGAMMAYPYSLAKALAEKGAQIRCIYRTRFTGSEPEAEKWLRSALPSLRLVEDLPRNHKRKARQAPRPEGEGYLFGLSLLHAELKQFIQQVEEEL